MTILGINKPSGISSFDVVRKVKKITGIKKIGHGGTLDPMAEGVLPILLNEATVFFDLLLNSDKIYKAVIQLGSSTDTDDKEGQVLQTVPVPDIDIKQILQQIESLTGEISQIPPQYSALKINGKKAYELARAGEVVELASRIVKVYEWTDVSYDSEQITATIRCGSGTYIRSLARDLAEKLNTKGHLIALQRVYSGGIALEDTLSIDDLQDWESHQIPAEKALEFLPSLEWQWDLEYLKNGKPLGVYFKSLDDGVYKLMYLDKIIALVESQNNKISYKKNFANSYKNS